MKASALIGYKVGGFIAILTFILLMLPRCERFHAPGAANSGHEKLRCIVCHIRARGTVRQQIQANVQHWLALRNNPVYFIYQPVGNRECQACHERPNDNHPAHRFQEPRFKKAREKIGAHSCISCHREHQGVRVTIAPDYCDNCHQDLKIKNDPLDIKHEALIRKNRWSTCLGCHDFHGNHIMQLANKVDRAIPYDEISDYFNGGPSPYSQQKHYAAKRSIVD